MRFLVLLLLLLLSAACAGGGEDSFAGDEFPTPAFEDGFDEAVPLDDSMLSATIEARVARTITAQDAALATAVAEGVNRVLRGDQALPTPNSLAEDAVRVPVFRRGGAPTPAVAAGTPRPTTAAPGFCPAGLEFHVSADPAYVFCHPDGWRLIDVGPGVRFEAPDARGYAAARPVSAPAGSDAGMLFHGFMQDVFAAESRDAGWKLVSDSVNDDYGRRGLTYEYRHYAPPPADCLERVTAKVHLTEQRADATAGYAVIFAVCDAFSGEYGLLRSGVLSGFREGGR